MGKAAVLFADLLNNEESIVLSGTLAHVIRTCEERGYHVSNMEQAKLALSKQ